MSGLSSSSLAVTLVRCHPAGSSVQGFWPLKRRAMNDPLSSAIATKVGPKLAENLAKAEKLLCRFNGRRLLHFIDGGPDEGR